MRELEEVQRQIEVAGTGRADVTLRTNNLSVTDTLRVKQTGTNGEPIADDTGSAMTSWGLSGMSSMLDIPVAYLKRCPRGLASDQLNYWLHHGNRRKVKVCFKENTIIGVVSDRFVQFKNEEFLRTVVQALKDEGTDVRVVSYEVSNECFDCSLILPDIWRWASHAPDRKLHMGLHLRNSEVGFASATVAATIRDTVKGIGMCIDEQLIKNAFARLIHVGRYRRIELYVHAIQTLVESIEKDGKRILDLYERLHDHTITVGNLDALFEEFRLSKDTLEAKLGINLSNKKLDRNAKFNLFDVVEGIAETGAEKKYPARWEIEKVAGSIMSRLAAEILR